MPAPGRADLDVQASELEPLGVGTEVQEPEQPVGSLRHQEVGIVRRVGGGDGGAERGDGAGLVDHGLVHGGLRHRRVGRGQRRPRQRHELVGVPRTGIPNDHRHVVPHGRTPRCRRPRVSNVLHIPAGRDRASPSSGVGSRNAEGGAGDRSGRCPTGAAQNPAGWEAAMAMRLATEIVSWARRAHR